MTLTELLVGFRMAHGTTTAALRARTLAKARSFVTMPYDEPVAEALADLLVSARAQDRRAPMPDAVIAATALVHDLTVWTLDRDFEVLAELEPDLQIQMA